MSPVLFAHGRNIHVVTVADPAVRRDNLALSADFAYGDVIDGSGRAEISLGGTSLYTAV